ncbi:MAG: hypothetical protein ACRCVT_05930 [Leadbetterella sp.]
MSNLGIFHTAIGLIALLFGILAFIKDGKIGFSGRNDLMYVVLTLITCATSFMIFKTGKAGPGHILAGLILVFMVLAYFTRNAGAFWVKFVSIASMSTTFFFSLIPTFNETLTRLPVDSPWASGPEDPLVQNVLKGLALLFLVGVFLQFRSLKKAS